MNTDVRKWSWVSSSGSNTNTSGPENMVPTLYVRTWLCFLHPLKQKREEAIKSRWDELFQEENRLYEMKEDQISLQLEKSLMTRAKLTLILHNNTPFYVFFFLESKCETVFYGTQFCNKFLL